MFNPQSLKKSLVSLSQFSLGTAPSHEQLDVTHSLALDLSKPFVDSQDTHLLTTLHSLITRQVVSNTPPPLYSRTGEWWKWSLGFQHSDPVSDIRGGGILSLKNLIFFLANHPLKATQMIKSRSGQIVSADQTYPSFPWACAGINLTRVLALEFEIVLPTGCVNTGINAKYSKKTTWSYLMEENGFNRMYVCLFLLLDCLRDEMGATYMDFNYVLKAVTEEFSMLLALSSSLSNLENRVHQRVNFMDPDVGDYTSLPEAPSLDREISFDMEGQSRSSERNDDDLVNRNESTEEGPLLSFLSSHMPSYDQVVSTLMPSSTEPILPDFISSHTDHDKQKAYQQQYEQQCGQHNSMQHMTAYNLQIV